MPYSVKQQNGEYCVVKSDGEVVKCHSGKEEALAHMRALWANVQDSAMAEFSMSIVKATSRNGEMAWRSVNSDIEEDFFGEKMSLELFADFDKHIENNEAIPAVFKNAICEEDWCGGMPYMSIAHYKSGTGKVNLPGEVTSVYVDGKALKSTGVLFDTPLGKAVYKSLKKDLVEKSKIPVRISIGFLDTEHTHGDKFTFTRKTLADKCPLCKEGIGDKIYKKGHLVHLALTRVPANPRTEMELEQKSMTTKIQDAESVIGDEELVKTLDLKSMTEDVLVIKAKDTVDANAETAAEDATENCEEGDEECMKKKKPFVKESIVVSSSSVPEPVKPADVEPSAVEKSMAFLVERIAALKAQGMTGDNALAEIQKNFDELGNVVKAEFTVPLSPEEIVKQNMAEIVRSALSEMLPQALAQIAPAQGELATLRSELAELRALTQSPKLIRKEETPQPRSLSASLVQKAAIEKVLNKKKDQAQAIAEASVGLYQ